MPGLSGVTVAYTSLQGVSGQLPKSYARDAAKLSEKLNDVGDNTFAEIMARQTGSQQYANREADVSDKLPGSTPSEFTPGGNGIVI